MRTLGLLGGMSWESTLPYYRYVNERVRERLGGLHSAQCLMFSVDFATIEHDVIHADRPGEISGVSLIDGEPAELIDAHWLFAHHVGTTARLAEPLVCRLPSDDPWMQNMLRPIVEAAGYRVVGDDSEVEADLVIASQGDSIGSDEGRTIWLRTEPEPTGKKDASIYRYDRAGLLMALKSAGRAK